MEFPILPNRRNASSRTLRGTAVQVNPKATQPQSLKPKVVSIPVHFVGSEHRGSHQPIIKDRYELAIKIQKVFRGFLVRRNMEKIKTMGEEVKAIERNISKTEIVDLIRSDSRERLKVNEMLMSLLLKLDSIRGVDSGVRDCRKSVIKKAVALQERLDAIVSGDQQTVDTNNAEAVDQSQIHDVITDSADKCNESSESQNHGRDDEINNQCRDKFLPNLSESEVIIQDQETVDESNDRQDAANQDQCQEEDEDEKGMETNRSESQTDSSANPEPENVVEQEEAAAAAVDENETYCQSDGEIEKAGNNREEDKRSKEMLQRIMEDNEKMTGLMQVLYERNEMQTRLVSALTQRVEKLEKAYMFDKLRKKKRRNSAAAPVDCGVKKCGKR